MTEAPLVSVLIKAFNHAPYVRQTIDSILNQSLQDFEVVVTDDASTDGTPEIVRGFTDPRIRLQVMPRNLGISGAMNATIASTRPLFRHPQLRRLGFAGQIASAGRISGGKPCLVAGLWPAAAGR